MLVAKELIEKANESITFVSSDLEFLAKEYVKNNPLAAAYIYDVLRIATDLEKKIRHINTLIQED
jgi:hypothetical protein